jgi:hypothetical protein
MNKIYSSVLAPAIAAAAMFAPLVTASAASTLTIGVPSNGSVPANPYISGSQSSVSGSLLVTSSASASPRLGDGIAGPNDTLGGWALADSANGSVSTTGAVASGSNGVLTGSDSTTFVFGPGGSISTAGAVAADANGSAGSSVAAGVVPRGLPNTGAAPVSTGGSR